MRWCLTHFALFLGTRLHSMSQLPSGGEMWPCDDFRPMSEREKLGVSLLGLAGKYFLRGPLICFFHFLYWGLAAGALGDMGRQECLSSIFPLKSLGEHQTKQNKTPNSVSMSHP